MVPVNQFIIVVYSAFTAKAKTIMIFIIIHLKESIESLIRK